MSEQLSLGMVSRLAYSPRNFCVHSGVSSIVNGVLHSCSQQNFSLVGIEGAARSGKTHLSIYLTDRLLNDGFYPVNVDSQRLTHWFRENYISKELSSKDVLIVDDADEYLEQLSPEQYGQFVTLVEDYRRYSANIVLFSTSALVDLPANGHVMSRLKAAELYQIGHISEGETTELIASMARQRGFELSPKKIEYLQKRLGRGISEVEEYFERVDYLSRVLGSSIKFPLLSDAL